MSASHRAVATTLLFVVGLSVVGGRAASAQPNLDAVRATVTLGGTIGAIGSQGIALDPTTGLVYIVINGTITGFCDGDPLKNPSAPRTRRYGDNQMSIINPSTAREIALVPTGGAPVWPTVDPIRRVVFVANSGSGTVTIHDAATGAAAGSVDVGGMPHMGGLDYTTRLMVVGNTVSRGDTAATQNHASIVDTPTNNVVRAFESGPAPHGMAVDQERHLAYFTSVGDGSITVVNMTTGQDLFSAVPKSIYGTAQGNNNMLARQAATRRLFQANSQTGYAGALVVDEVTLKAEGLIRFGSFNPWGLWVDEPNRLLFAALPNANAIGVADLDTLTHVATIPVGACPYSVAVDPDRHIGATSNQGSPTVGSSSSIFDACVVYKAAGRVVSGCP